MFRGFWEGIPWSYHHHLRCPRYPLILTTAWPISIGVHGCWSQDIGCRGDTQNPGFGKLYRPEIFSLTYRHIFIYSYILYVLHIISALYFLCLVYLKLLYDYMSIYCYYVFGTLGVWWNNHFPSKDLVSNKRPVKNMVVLGSRCTYCWRLKSCTSWGW